METVMVDVNSMISACSLKEGGIAIFAPIIKNHSIASCGAKVIVPFVRKMLRVCMFW